MHNLTIRNVLVIDDHPMVLEVMSAIAKRAFSNAEIFPAECLEEALGIGQRLASVDLILLDLGLPGYSGISALTAVRKLFPSARVLVVSAMDERHVILATLQSGACGFVPKSSKPPVITAALQLVAAGGIYVPPLALGDLDSARDAGVSHVDLTCRQRDVLRLIVKGLGNKQIAQHLRIAQDTVKQHAKALFSVLGVASRGQAARAAEQRGIKLD